MIDRYYWPRRTAGRYAVDRYTDEGKRLCSILAGQLAGREYICGDYSIADMACWPWIVPHERQGLALGDYPNVQRWYETMKARPALRRGFDVLREIRTTGMDAKAKEILFGQTGAAKP
jgi:GST-like protein